MVDIKSVYKYVARDMVDMDLEDRYLVRFDRTMTSIEVLKVRYYSNSSFNVINKTDLSIITNILKKYDFSLSAIYGGDLMFIEMRFEYDGGKR